MIIDSIEKYKGKTYKVELENYETYFWHLDIINEYHLKEDVDIPDSVLSEIIFSNDFRKARERALYLLDYRDYSYYDLFKKLELNYSDDVCYKVMERMVELGAINDERYSAKLADYYINTKKFGYYRAMQEMRRKGVSKELCETSLSEYEDTVYERLYELVKKKYIRYLEDENGIKKVKASLQRYGYAYDIINIVIDDILDE